MKGFGANKPSVGIPQGTLISKLEVYPDPWSITIDYQVHTLVEHQYLPSGSDKFVQLFWCSVAPSCNLNGNTQAFLWSELNSVTKHLDKIFCLFSSSFSFWQIVVVRAPTLASSIPSFSWQSCCFGPRKWIKKVVNVRLNFEEHLRSRGLTLLFYQIEP